MGAGHETTATTAAAALHAVGAHPQVEARLLAELREVLGECGQRLEGHSWLHSLSSSLVCASIHHCRVPSSATMPSRGLLHTVPSHRPASSTPPCPSRRPAAVLRRPAAPALPDGCGQGGAAPLPRHPALPALRRRPRRAALGARHPRGWAGGPTGGGGWTHGARAVWRRPPADALGRRRPASTRPPPPPSRPARRRRGVHAPLRAAPSPHHEHLAPRLSPPFPVPAGDVVFMSSYALHRTPAVWDDPLRFDPER